jgi:hypothetical protein
MHQVFMEWWFEVLLLNFQVKFLAILWVVKLCEQSYLNQMAKYVSKEGRDITGGE